MSLTSDQIVNNVVTGEVAAGWDDLDNYLYELEKARKYHNLEEVSKAAGQIRDSAIIMLSFEELGNMIEKEL